MDADVIVVGARVAGSSTAFLLARIGFRVLLLDQAAELGATLSSHQMNAVASDCLHSWGIYDKVLNSDCPAIRELSFNFGNISIVSKVPTSGSIDSLHYCKRKYLDKLLLSEAISYGVDFLPSTRFLKISRQWDSGVSIEVKLANGDFRRLTASFLVAADGRSSKVACELNTPKYNTISDRAISCFGYFDGAETDKLEIFVNNSRSLAMFPTNDNETCIVLAEKPGLADSEGLDKYGLLDGAIARWSRLRERFPTERVTNSRVYRFNGVESFFRKPFLGRVVLVGDAGYFRDPIVGDGIGDAMLSAEMVSNQIAKCLQGSSVQASLGIYQVVRDSFFNSAFERTRRSLRFNYDYDSLGNAVAEKELDDSILGRMFSAFLSANRGSRKELFSMLDVANENSNANVM